MGVLLQLWCACEWGLGRGRRTAEGRQTRMPLVLECPRGEPLIAERGREWREMSSVKSLLSRLAHPAPFMPRHLCLTDPWHIPDARLAEVHLARTTCTKSSTFYSATSTAESRLMDSLALGGAEAHHTSHRGDVRALIAAAERPSRTRWSGRAVPIVKHLPPPP